MNNQTTRFARGAKCGCRAVHGFAAADSASWPRELRPARAASASPPSPPPARAKNSLRVAGICMEQGRVTVDIAVQNFQSIDKQKLGGVHQGMTKIHIGGGLMRL